MKAWTETRPEEPEPQPTPATPHLLKTRIAREAAVAVLLEAGKPMTRGEALERACATPKVQSAGVSRGTVSAQLTAALSEAPPRIVRIGRGIYAAAEIAAEIDAEHVVSDEKRPAVG